MRIIIAVRGRLDQKRSEAGLVMGRVPYLHAVMKILGRGGGGGGGVSISGLTSMAFKNSIYCMNSRLQASASARFSVYK